MRFWKMCDFENILKCINPEFHHFYCPVSDFHSIPARRLHLVIINGLGPPIEFVAKELSRLMKLPRYHRYRIVSWYKRCPLKCGGGSTWRYIKRSFSRLVPCQPLLKCPYIIIEKKWQISLNSISSGLKINSRIGFSDS